MQKVRFVFLDTELADQYRSVNREVLLKQRPCLFMAKLRYRGIFQDFAIPLRSNVNPNSLAQGYFYELPPRVSTQLNKVHALDFRKMMPVERRFTRPFQFYNQEDRLSTLVPIQKNYERMPKLSRRIRKSPGKNFIFN